MWMLPVRSGLHPRGRIERFLCYLYYRLKILVGMVSEGKLNMIWEPIGCMCNQKCAVQIPPEGECWGVGRGGLKSIYASITLFVCTYLCHKFLWKNSVEMRSFSRLSWLHLIPQRAACTISPQERSWYQTQLLPSAFSNPCCPHILNPNNYFFYLGLERK